MKVGVKFCNDKFINFFYRKDKDDAVTLAQRLKMNKIMSIQDSPV